MSEENVNRELDPKDLEKVSGGTASTDPMTAGYASESVPADSEPAPTPN